MSNPGKGGRGKSAPYLTTHYRIPEPIKPVVERLAGAYRILAGSKNWSSCNSLLERVDAAIADTNQDDRHQFNIYEAIIEKQQTDLTTIQKQLDELKSEKERVVNILVPSLELKPQQGRKIQDAIKLAFPELKKE